MEKITAKHRKKEIEYFFNCLDKLDKALESGTPDDVVTASMRVYYALDNIPKSYERHINKLLKKAIRGEYPTSFTK